MIYRALYRKFKTPNCLLAGIVGSGHYGTAIITQAVDSEYLKIPIVADRNIASARMAYKRAGLPDSQIVNCDSVAGAKAAIEPGKYAVVEDPMILMDLPLDVIVESTGIAEAGAVHALAAINHGKHVAMVNKETDSAVGPILQNLARKQGLTYTQVDGDHPGLLIGLVYWAKALGLEIVAAGKSRDAELVLDRRSGMVTCAADGITVLETKTARLTGQEVELFDDLRDGEVSKCIRARRELLKTMPGAEGYDLCEVAIAANATGLVPDVPSLHNPIVRTSDIPKVLCPKEEGGILAKSGVVEVIDCFRDKFEAGLGGAVFVVVSCKSDYSRMILTTKGLVSNSSGKSALIYRPYHLCGVETSTSIICAGLANMSTGSDEYVPRFDIVRSARRALQAGYMFGGDHDNNLTTSILPASSMAPGAPVPAHLLHNHKLLCDVSAGAIITFDMVAKPADSVLWTLRAQQNSTFSQGNTN
ncbi:MAG: NAD(P)H-dependent oxidoreductase [Bryobacteraceae bacterium]